MHCEIVTLSSVLLCSFLYGRATVRVLLQLSPVLVSGPGPEIVPAEPGPGPAGLHYFIMRVLQLSPRTQGPGPHDLQPLQAPEEKYFSPAI